MKWTFASTGLVAAGLVGVVIILLFQNITVNNEEDYYLLKEISQAAMIDAIDLAHFRDYGKLKIAQEKFVENFTRRFAEAANVLNTNNYSLGFYNIMEYPPKASVNIATNLGEYTIFGNHLESQEYSIANSLDSIIEIDEIEEQIDDCDVKKTYYSIPYVKYDNGKWNDYGITTPAPPAHVMGPDTDGDWHVTQIVPIGKVTTLSHYIIYDETYDTMYYTERTGWAASDLILSDYIARPDEVEIKSLKVFEEADQTKVSWSARYKCRAGTTAFSTFGGYEHKQEQCIIGIIYYLVWHNNACVE